MNTVCMYQKESEKKNERYTAGKLIQDYLLSCS